VETRSGNADKWGLREGSKRQDCLDDGKMIEAVLNADG
jgi:hypothetical protein